MKVIMDHHLHGDPFSKKVTFIKLYYTNIMNQDLSAPDYREKIRMEKMCNPLVIQKNKNCEEYINDIIKKNRFKFNDQELIKQLSVYDRADSKPHQRSDESPIVVSARKKPQTNIE